MSLATGEIEKGKFTLRSMRGQFYLKSDGQVAGYSVEDAQDIIDLMKAHIELNKKNG